jgi:hypothetical protein
MTEMSIMPDGPNNWRIRPAAAAAREIHQLALRENRSHANMATTLILEALEMRRRRAERMEEQHA